MANPIAGDQELIESYRARIARIELACQTHWVVRHRDVGLFTWTAFTPRGGSMPSQGWKIHVSAAASEAIWLVDKVAKYLLRRRIAFKIPARITGFICINEGMAGATQIGKILTIYPPSDDHAASILVAVRRLWPHTKGPQIPSDLPLEPGSPIGIRYGAFDSQLVYVHPNGLQSFGLKRPDGTLVADDRRMDGSQPAWAPPPPVKCARQFASPLYALAAKNLGVLPLVLLHGSIKGSVHLCLDLDTGRSCILKSAPRGVGGDLEGQDVVDRLMNERNVLLALKPKSLRIPSSHRFVRLDSGGAHVMSDIDGQILAKVNPAERIRLLPLFAAEIDKLHHVGFAHRDIKLYNATVVSGKVHLLDFEFAARIGARKCQGGGTPGYIPPEGNTVPVDASTDVYALGISIAHAVLDCDPAILVRDAGRVIGLLHANGEHLASNVVKKFVAQDPRRRPSAAVAVRLLHKLRKSLAGRPIGTCLSGAVRPHSLDKWQLRAAFEAAQCSRRYLTMSDKGGVWANRHHLADFNCIGLNLGSSGIILGLLTLRRALNTTQFDPDIIAGAEGLTNSPNQANPAGLFTGSAGAAVALGCAARLTRSNRFAEASISYLELAQSKCLAADLFAGSAGVLWAACMLSKILSSGEPLAIVESSAKKLMSEHTIVENIPVWPNTNTNGSTEHLFGAAHGASGIALALATWADCTGKEAPRKLSATTLIELWEYCKRRRVQSIPLGIEEPNEGPLTNWCHGTAGYLWCLLQLRRRGREVIEAIRWAAKTFLAAPALHNPTYCHGLAGELELLRMLGAHKEWSIAAELKAQQIVSILRILHRTDKGLTTWASDDATITTPDLWIGFLGPAASLALHAIKYRRALLCESWLMECSEPNP